MVKQLREVEVGGRRKVSDGDRGSWRRGPTLRAMYLCITPPTLSRIFDLSGTLEKWCELAGNLGLRLGGRVGSLCT